MRSGSWNTEPATAHEHVRALAVAVCDGELTPEQRERLGVLLHSLAIATALAPRAERIHADNDARTALEYLAGTWEPVRRPYAELAATVGSGVEEHGA